MDYKKLEDKIIKYQLDRGWINQAPVDHVKSIIIEAAELLEHFQWDETSRIQGTEKSINDKDVEGILDEIGDVGVYLIELCLALDVDLIEVINKKLDKVINKYPADKIKNDTHEEKFYTSQKKKLRENRK